MELSDASQWIETEKKSIINIKKKKIEEKEIKKCIVTVNNGIKQLAILDGIQTMHILYSIYLKKEFSVTVICNTWEQI